MVSEHHDSARARLIKTRQGTSIDESLLPAARQECLDILVKAAPEAIGQDTFLAGWISGVVDYKADEFWTDWTEQRPKSPVRKQINDTTEILDEREAFEGLSTSEFFDFLAHVHRSIESRHHSPSDQEEGNALTEEPGPKGIPNPFKGKIILDLLLDVLRERGIIRMLMESDFVPSPLEELRAGELAREARETARVCGCCGRELPTSEPAYFGMEVYTGMWPLYWDRFSKPQIGKPRYERTVLCRSCAPEWLSPERDDVATQLCAHCERLMISPLELSQLRRTLCSDPCREAYRNQLRKEKRAEERKKICEVCGEEFIATRRDTKTCSARCKQKAYRQRKKEVKQD